MRPSNPVTVGHCTITGEQHLPTALGGSAAVCAIIERAITARAPTATYTAQLKVHPRSRLSAVLVVNGHPLPEQNFAVMDRELSKATVQRFADTLAGLVSDAAGSARSRS